MIAQTQILVSEYANVTTVHPVGVVLFVLACMLVFLGKPQHGAAVAVLFSWVVVPSQRFVLLGLDVSFYRVIGLAVLASAWLYASDRRRHWITADLSISGLAAATVLATAARGGAITNSLGLAGDLVVYYAVGRLCILDSEHWVKFVQMLAIATILVSIFLAIEKLTSRNVFAVFGGVSFATPIREGKLRAQAAFVHPIMAGVIIASLVPVFLSIRSVVTSRARVIFSVAACSGVCGVFLTASSTPLMALAAGLAAYSLFSQRRHLVTAAIVVLAGGACLHFLSAAGLHHLVFARFVAVSGSTGYHRYMLWDAAIEKFFEWSLFGTDSTSHWGWGLGDVTCEYIAAGVRAGLLGLIFLCSAILAVSRAAWRRSLEVQDRGRMMYWGMFCWLFANAVAFMAVSYFGQGATFFAVGLGAIASLTQARTEKNVSMARWVTRSS